MTISKTEAISRSEVFCEKGAPKNFAKFTRKHLCQSLFLINCRPVCSFIKKETLAQAFSCQLFEIFKSTSSYKTPLVAASVRSFFSILLTYASPLPQNIST